VIKMNKKQILLSLSGAMTIALVGMGCTDSQAKPKPNIVTKDGTKPGIVAKIGDLEITEEELIGEAKSEFFELKKREYDLRMERLNQLMEKKLLEPEAQKAGMKYEEFIEKKVIGKITISDAEYKKFVKEKKIPDDQLKQHPEYKERITQFLENQKKQESVQAYLAKLTKSKPVEVYFKKPEMERVQVAIGDAPVMGKKDAKIQIVAFSDFQCPYCSRGADVSHELQKKYGNKVVVAFKHYPLPFHQQAIPASEISMCVKKLGGDDKFWKFHDITFKKQDKMDNDSLLANAKEAGVDQAKTKECFEKGEFKDAVKADMDYGNKLGVRSTPTFFINGQLVAGALPIEQFSEMVDEELNKK
jgi:protein-disulfide isomerase